MGSTTEGGLCITIGRKSSLMMSHCDDTLTVVAGVE